MFRAICVNTHHSWTMMHTSVNLFFFNQFFETDLLNELIHYNNVDFPMLTQAQ